MVLFQESQLETYESFDVIIIKIHNGQKLKIPRKWRFMAANNIHENFDKMFDKGDQ